jgi:hypothetical protein
MCRPQKSGGIFNNALLAYGFVNLVKVRSGLYVQVLLLIGNIWPKVAQVIKNAGCCQ